MVTSLDVETPFVLFSLVVVVVGNRNSYSSLFTSCSRSDLRYVGKNIVTFIVFTSINPYIKSDFFFVSCLFSYIQSLFQVLFDSACPTLKGEYSTYFDARLCFDRTI